jgi:hypothetical protein
MDLNIQRRKKAGKLLNAPTSFLDGCTCFDSAATHFSFE